MPRGQWDATKNDQDCSEQSRLLLVSMRHLKLHVSRSISYEFEDVICNFDTKDDRTESSSQELSGSGQYTYDEHEIIERSQLVQKLHKHGALRLA